MPLGAETEAAPWFDPLASAPGGGHGPLRLLLNFQLNS